VHFKNHAIAVVPLDEQLNTYLVGQYRFPINQYSWEIPEGGCPLGEDHLQAAQRELLEETGLKAQHWEHIADVHLSNSVSDEAGSVFVATGLTQEAPAPEETEQLVIKKLPFEEVYNMAVSGTITDMLSVTAILRVKLMLLNGDLQAKYVSVE
jgi:8-oxo-dGTP pyrophosphatase MutT (NUDIX family)